MNPKFVSHNWRPGRAAWAGLVATIVYSIVMEGDKAIIGNRFSDTRFIQGLLEGKKRSRGIFLLSWLHPSAERSRPGRTLWSSCQTFPARSRLAQGHTLWGDLYYRRMVAYPNRRQVSSPH